MYTTPRKLSTLFHLSTIYEDDKILHILSVDSRTIHSPESTVFFALDGPRRSGLDFIEPLIKDGIRNFVVPTCFENKKFPAEIYFYPVEDVLDAFQLLVKAERKNYTLPVIGITGSNGKTIIKEWLAHLLKDQYKIVKSPKSYNSQIGVPLSVWNLHSDTELGIFEAGISQKGEMQKLEEIILPNIGILTNIGDAHQENFSSIEEKLQEKLKLFASCEVIICSEKLRTSYARAIQEFLGAHPHLHIRTWNREDLILEEESDEKLIRYQGIVIWRGSEKKDDIWLDNLYTCLSTITYLGIDIHSIKESIPTLSSVSMRLEKIEGIHQITLINDTYNADRDSLEVALNFLQLQPADKKAIIVSEISQLTPEEALELIQRYPLTTCICIGENYRHVAIQSKHTNFEYYDSADDFIQNKAEIELQRYTILIKGARKYQLEKITEKYRLRSHSAFLAVHLNALRNNLQVYANLLEPSTKMMVMLKAHGYGLGSVELAKMLEGQKVHYFAVAYTDEGIELRKAGIRTPIMIMNPEFNDLERLLDYQLDAEVYSLNFLVRIVEKSKSIQQENTLSIHLKIESGMHRLGIPSHDIQAVIDILQTNRQIAVRGIMSHLAASDDQNYDDFTDIQYDRFMTAADQIKKDLDINPILHIVNTGGIVRHPSYHLDMVRLGIGLFGFDSSQSVQSKLNHTISLLAKISQIKTVTHGETIGYSRNGQTDRETRIAILNLGYADGYARRFGNGRAKVFIKGQFFPTIGNICMDMIMVDITDGQQIIEGDTVELIGVHIPIWRLAQIAETIPYEIITSISNRVQRLYYED